jgi:hypothetical protein
MSPKVARAGPVILSGSYPLLNTIYMIKIVIKVKIIPETTPAIITIEMILIGSGYRLNKKIVERYASNPIIIETKKLKIKDPIIFCFNSMFQMFFTSIIPK